MYLTVCLSKCCHHVEAGNLKDARKRFKELRREGVKVRLMLHGGDTYRDSTAPRLASFCHALHVGEVPECRS